MMSSEHHNFTLESTSNPIILDPSDPQPSLVTQKPLLPPDMIISNLKLYCVCLSVPLSVCDISSNIYNLVKSKDIDTHLSGLVPGGLPR